MPIMNQDIAASSSCIGQIQGKVEASAYYAPIETLVREVITDGGSDNGHVYFQDLLIGEKAKDNTDEDTSSSSQAISDLNRDYSFEIKVPYLLHLEIPRNLNYAMDFAVKLVTFTADNTESGNLDSNKKADFGDGNYQLLRYIHVPQAEGGTKNFSRVCLFPITVPEKESEKESQEKVIVRIPNEYSEDEYSVVTEEEKKILELQNNKGNAVGIKPDTLILLTPKKSIFTHGASAGKYYYYPNEEKGLEEITEKNDALLAHTWESIQTNNQKAVIDIIFSNKVVGTAQSYNGILLEMVREQKDLDIQSDISDKNKDVTGRFVEGDTVVASIRKLNNLIDNNIYSAYSHFGIWAAPNFLFSVNGEELRVGESGFYELNNFNTTTLAVAPKITNNECEFFTIDYTATLKDEKVKSTTSNTIINKVLKQRKR